MSGGIHLENLNLKNFEPNANIGMFSSLLNAGIGNIAPTRANMDFLAKNKNIARRLQRESKIENVRGNVSNILMSTGNPIAMAVGGVDMLGRTVDNLAKDEFGIYKSNFAGVADRILDPIGDFQDLFTGDSQKKRVAARDRYFNIEEQNDIADARQQGTIIANSLPQYRTPAYGKYGRKLKTKFSANGKF